MGGTKEELLKMFGDAVQAFNRATIKENKPDRDASIKEDFGRFLHENAVVYEKQTGGPGHYPKDSAVAFLQTQCDDRPQFNAMNPIVQVGPNGASGSVGTIHGKAHWYDDNNKKKNTGPDDLVFSFTFIWVKDRWLFSTLRATLA